MNSSAAVDDYLSNLDQDRQAAVSKLREVIRDNLPTGFEETLSGTMPSYVVPLDLYPAGYHVGKDTPLPFVSFASQKGHVALYHFGMYVDQELIAWFETEYAKRVEHKLDMGKSCVRFKKPEQIPFELIGELMQQRTVEDWVTCYDGMRPK